MLVALGTLAGASFLLWYGWRSFRSARRPRTLQTEGRAAQTPGTVLASWTWVFGLALLAGRLAPLMRSPRAWQVLDVLIGVVMWGLAGGLVVGCGCGKHDVFAPPP